jgi:hypothetical protein
MRVKAGRVVKTKDLSNEKSGKSFELVQPNSREVKNSLSSKKLSKPLNGSAGSALRSVMPPVR